MALHPAGLVVTGAAPRAVGVRTQYTGIPDRVRSWVDAALGSPVVGIEEQVGGMSPGCATRVVTESGTRAFVKAVGPELNPLTPDMVRNEARVLGALPQHTLWPGLLASYDGPGGWVALLLEDVPGRHVDTTSPGDVELVLEAAATLGEELALHEPAPGLATCRAGIERWGEVWPEAATLPSGVLPSWVVERREELQSAYTELLEHADGDALVHADLRNDNMIVPSGERGGSVVFVDWGGARRGPSWYDPLMLCLEWVEDPTFDDLVHTFPAVRAFGDEHVTTYLATFGSWLLYRAEVAEDIGLPTLKEFRRREAARLLEGARRRLDLPRE